MSKNMYTKFGRKRPSGSPDISDITFFVTHRQTHTMEKAFPLRAYGPLVCDYHTQCRNYVVLV